MSCALRGLGLFSVEVFDPRASPYTLIGGQAAAEGLDSSEPSDPKKLKYRSSKQDELPDVEFRRRDSPSDYFGAAEGSVSEFDQPFGERGSSSSTFHNDEDAVSSAKRPTDVDDLSVAFGHSMQRMSPHPPEEPVTRAPSSSTSFVQPTKEIELSPAARAGLTPIGNLIMTVATWSFFMFAVGIYK